MNTENAIEFNSEDENVVFTGINHLVTESSSQVSMQTLEKNFFDKERYERDNVVDTIETVMHDATSFAMDCILMPRVGVAVRSANVPSTRNSICVIVTARLRGLWTVSL